MSRIAPLLKPHAELRTAARNALLRLPPDAPLLWLIGHAAILGYLRRDLHAHLQDECLSAWIANGLPVIEAPSHTYRLSCHSNMISNKALLRWIAAHGSLRGDSSLARRRSSCAAGGRARGAAMRARLIANQMRRDKYATSQGKKSAERGNVKGKSKVKPKGKGRKAPAGGS